jgi:hypothetical protein
MRSPVNHCTHAVADRLISRLLLMSIAFVKDAPIAGYQFARPHAQHTVHSVARLYAGVAMGKLQGFEVYSTSPDSSCKKPRGMLFFVPCNPNEST